MKLRKCTVLTILACLAQVSMAGATMIENNTNLSAEWTRMPARVAATDSVDAAIYNPAGTIRLGEGTFIWASNQVLPKDYNLYTAPTSTKSMAAMSWTTKSQAQALPRSSASTICPHRP